MARRILKLGGLSNSLSETVEAEGTAWVAVNCLTDNGVIEGSKRYNRIGQRSSYNASDVGYGLGYAKWSGNEVQKIQITGSPTGGTFKLTFTASTQAVADALGVALNTVFSHADTCAFNASVGDFYAYLQKLANGANKAFYPNDIIITGSQFPTGIMEVEFAGRLANLDIPLLVLATNSLTGGTTPTVSITEKKKGGDHEIYYTVVQHNGSGDANLYAVTTSDGFVTTTWTSLATDFDSSDWFFEQYYDQMFMANATDGLKKVYIGTSTIAADPPKPGTITPTFDVLRDLEDLYFGTGATYAQTGFTTAPTMAVQGTTGMRITLNGTEDGNAVVVTVTLAATADYSANDIAGLRWLELGGLSLVPGTMVLKLINGDGSPVTISAIATSEQFNEGSFTHFRYFQFGGNVRYSRDNITKLQLSFTIDEGSVGDYISIFGWIGSNWMNDTETMNMGVPPNELPAPTTTFIEYAYAYYRGSDGVESALSPIGTSPAVPGHLDGRYLSINCQPSLETGVTLVMFYRREKGSQKWRRVPNTTTVQNLQIADYGITNPAYPISIYDHRMEYELANFPEYVQKGFPPISSGQKANQLGVWKQCLCVASGKLAYLSWVGDPLRFEPSPDTAGYIAPDPDENPDVGETSYVSDNRAENVYGLHGQDTLYAITPLSCYAKVGDSPALSSVFRRLPGSRGTLGYRSSRRYGAGVVVMSQDGFWYYAVGRGFSGEDNGALQEREETRDVRRSYRRLISPCFKLEFVGEDDVLYTVTVTEGSDTYVVPSITSIWKAHDAQKALEVILGRGNVEVFGDREAGHLFIRLIGRFANGTPTLTASGDTGLSVTVSTISSGGGTGAVATEYEDEYWLFNGKQFMSNAQNRGWVEGVFADSVKAATVNRERGLVFQDSTGRLHRIKTGFSTDNGEAVWFEYQTPWLTGDRSRLTAVGGAFIGSPKIRILSDDGRTGIRTKDVPLQEDRFNNFNSGQLPGLKHKIQVFGLAGRDEIQKLWVEIEDAGGDTGS